MTEELPKDLWGPLAPLIGDWEGEGGLDRAFAHGVNKVVDTPFLERTSMKPFGPVENGRQVLYGLDYRGAMWRGDEENPFHTEVGYWLWDAAGQQVMRGFVVPRGISVLAGGPATADSTELTLSASLGSNTYGIAENFYLSSVASTVAYQSRITINEDGSWSYDETTSLLMANLPDPLAHTDRNTLHRVSA